MCLHRHLTDSVTGDAVVPTEEYGDVKIENLFTLAAEEDDSEVFEKQGRDFVFPKDINTFSTRFGNKARPDAVDYIERHKTTKRLYRVTVGTGESVVVTADHSIMVRTENGRLEERSPTDLEPGDTVLRLAKTPSPNTED